MQAPTPRFYSFVSRFVGAVTTSALTQELARARRFRAMMHAAYGAPQEPAPTLPEAGEHLDEVLAA